MGVHHLGVAGLHHGHLVNVGLDQHLRRDRPPQVGVGGGHSAHHERVERGRALPHGGEPPVLNRSLVCVVEVLALCLQPAAVQEGGADAAELPQADAPERVGDDLGATLARQARHEIADLRKVLDLGRPPDLLPLQGALQLVDGRIQARRGKRREKLVRLHAALQVHGGGLHDVPHRRAERAEAPGNFQVVLIGRGFSGSFLRQDLVRGRSRAWRGGILEGRSN
mmetsp:Transcript_43583/g.128998  ORF Transcript_43583/g.128998 Transcript_43583/m.128998 type:complete len:224 (+) Transcript_43583:25-696(+)